LGGVSNPSITEARDNQGELVFQAGTHEDAIRLAVEDWLPVVNPRVGSFTEPEHPSHQVAVTDRENAEPPEWEGASEARAEEARRESGVPGGGNPKKRALAP